MIENLEKISLRQVIFLLVMSHLAIVLLSFSSSNQDIWISEIFALFYIAILSAPLLFLSKQFANLTLVEYIPILTGKWVGKILGVLYVAFFLFNATVDLSLFDNILRPINFPETPDYAIILLAVTSCAYAVYKGVECIARTAEIFAPQILAVIILYTALQVNDMDLKVFLPILADSTFSEINSLAFTTAARLNEIIVLAMLVPTINKKENINMIFMWTIILTTVFSLIIIVSTLAVLGIELPKKTFDPYYLFIKQVNIYDFITRMEYFMVGAWNVGMFMKISLWLYLATMGLVQVLGLKRRKVLIIPMAIVIFMTALKTDIIKSVVVFYILEYYVPNINLIFIFGIPAIVLVMFFLKKTMKMKSDCNR